MANGPDHHIKIVIGEIAARLAVVMAENDALKEELLKLKAQPPPRRAAQP